MGFTLVELLVVIAI
ncbi:MAG: prepilin-type N-terminal cleavage/methylation domain-containing protein, partial [Planctomycetaceae bacterium]|nr:prepilin-type N-terminal cleavage/methylation domain-containing protein [Planctomycetaceae bacterium]